MKTGNLDGQGIAQLQNYKFQMLSSAPTPAEAKFYYDTSLHSFRYYNGSEWIDGAKFAAGLGIDATAFASGTIAVSTTIASKTDIGNGALTIQRNSTPVGTFTANQTSATTVNITVPTSASDVGAVPTSRTINGKALTSNITITAADTGALPDSTTIGSANLTIQRNGTGIGTFSANATSATTVNISVPTTATEVGALPSDTVIGDGKVIFQKNGTAINTITANQTSTTTVNFTIPTAVTDLSDASNYALKSDVASAIIPKGSVSAISGLPSLIMGHVGWMYNFTSEFTTTSDFVEGAGKKYPAGTNVVVVSYYQGGYQYDDNIKYDIFSGFVDTTTYDSHIANTTIHVTASEKTTWNGKQNALTAGSNIQINGTTISATDTIYTLPAATTSTLGGVKVGSNLSIDGNGVLSALSYSEQNSALTQSGGLCTWVVTHNLDNSNVGVFVYEVATGERVMFDYTITSANAVTIKILSSSNVSADTYKVVVQG